MRRIDTLSATFTVAVVLSIGFFIYQAARDPEPRQVKVITKQVELTPKSPPKALLADWTQKHRTGGKIESPVYKKKEEASPVLISTPLVDQKTDAMQSDGLSDTPPILTDVHFRFDRSGLSQETRALLDRHVTVLQDRKWSVLIQGHTDQEGTIQQNLRVGLHRANAVKKYLIDHGIAPEQITVVSLGEYQPTCTQLTPECQYQNRRVSFFLTRRDPPKKHSSTVTASVHPSPVPLQKDWHTSEDGKEVVLPAAIHEAELSTTQDSSETLSQSLASLEPDRSIQQSDRPESVADPIPVGPIIPEPVHSTPPPALGSNLQSLENN